MPVTQISPELKKRLADAKLSALCLSGGGIRSATFGLGVLQGLAKYKLLQHVDYLSTVSGGGYIGGWLSSWIQRHPQGAAGVIRDLEASTKGVAKPEIEHLRTFSNYLAPNASILSADTWTLIKTYLRNLLINWLVLIPLLTAIITIPKLLLTLIPQARNEQDLMQGVVVSSSLVLASMLVALRYIVTRRPDASHVPRHLNSQSKFLAWCFLPLVFGVLATTVAWGRGSVPAIDYLKKHEVNLVLITAVAAAFVHTIAVLLAMIGNSPKPPGHRGFVMYRTPLRFANFIIAIISGLIVGALATIILIHLFPNPSGNAALYASFGPPLFMSLLPISGTVVVALASRGTSDEDREWWARAGGWLLIFMVAWAILAPLSLFAQWIVDSAQDVTGKAIALVGGAGGLIAILSGFSTRTGGLGAAADSSNGQRKLLHMAATGGAVAFLLALTVVLSLFGNWLQELIQKGLVATGAQPQDWARLTSPWVCFASLLGAGILVDRFTNLNSLSLHGIYRLRLMRAYLGATYRGRNPLSFTGFDPADDLQMRVLWPNACHADNAEQRNRPFHVINAALNIVAEDNLAWQQRKATSFTISPLHCGSGLEQLGYRSTRSYGGPISLATAVAISGAAVSPKMGYHSSPVVAFLLTLFNIRLGWWLGNPGHAGQATFKNPAPKLMLGPLISEAFGLSGVGNPYVYLSDGGHFDNLGLYEMVRRHCGHIIVIDAGADQNVAFFDLGNAVHKIRVDLGVEIRMSDRMFIKPRVKDKDKSPSGAYCAVGRIEYGSGLPAGRLLYIKPCIYEGEPLDVASRASRCPDFPHESTADQFFSESQFESYRALGQHIIEAIRKEPCWEYLRLDDFMEQARAHIWNQGVSNNGKPSEVKIDAVYGVGDSVLGFSVNIVGQGFSPMARVVCDCAIVESTIESPGRIKATLPPPPPGVTEVTIRVVNPNLDVAKSTWAISDATPIPLDV